MRRCGPDQQEQPLALPELVAASRNDPTSHAPRRCFGGCVSVSRRSFGRHLRRCEKSPGAWCPPARIPLEGERASDREPPHEKA